MSPRDRLPQALGSPESKRRYVRRLFATIAGRYDLITVLLSYGRDRHWKRRVADLAGVTRDTKALDLACGTGDIAFALADRGAHVTGLDITPAMLELARAKPHAGPGVSFVVGDMMALPFADAVFDVVTTGYGLRNVPGITTAIAEIGRVLGPHGRFVSLDFNKPAQPLVRVVYLTYLTVVGSVLGFILHRDPDTYRYIPESIRRYPGAEGVVALLRQHFAEVEHRPVLGGLMALHIARRPASAPPSR